VVIVGDGSPGCALTGRLSANPDERVLLLEAGPAQGPQEMAIAPAWPSLLGSSVDWG
jgi:choline dehydrogenase